MKLHTASPGRIPAQSMFWVAVFFWIQPGLAQEVLEEKLLEEQQDASEQSELLETLRELRSNPIDLNQATEKQLALLPGLTAKNRREIVRYRRAHGPFRAVVNLAEVPGLENVSLSEIFPLLTAKPGTRPAKPLFTLSTRTRVSRRIDCPLGFTDGTYASGPSKIYNRLKVNFLSNIEAGLLTEKDEGEDKLDDLRLFYAGTNSEAEIRLLLGNFQVQAGQGLVLWGPYGYSKSADPIRPLKKRARGIRPYLSVDENAGLFGIAASVDKDWFQALGFFSRNKLDATQVDTNEVTNIFASGLHRTDSERQKRDVVTKTLIGGRLAFRARTGLDLGATFYRLKFDRSFATPDVVRNRFGFSGDENHVAGLDWNYEAGILESFGEFARSKSGGTALISGARLDLNRVQFALLYRSYQRNFQNLHAFGFGERNGATQNERGYYSGMTFKVSPKTRLSAYYDIYRFPWRSFSEPMPLAGGDFFAVLEHQFDRTLDFTIRFRQKRREESEDFVDAFDRTFKKIVTKAQRQLRLQIDYRVNRALHLRPRVEFVQSHAIGSGGEISNTRQNGFLIYQDLKLNINRRLRLAGRLTFFDTDSFDSRVFQYENDLPGVVTNRALFGRGSRWYLLLRQILTRQVSLYLKYSETYRDDVETTGTGADRITGNLDRRIALQVQTRL